MQWRFQVNQITQINENEERKQPESYPGEVLKWITEEDWGESRKRKKHSKLTLNVRRRILTVISNYPQDYKVIKHIYRLSDSTIKRLKKEAKNDFQSSFEETLHNKRGEGLSKEELATLETIIVPPKPPLTISKITQEFNERSNENKSELQIRKTIKHELGYSYRTICSRVQKSQSNKNRLMKVLFWVKMMRLLYSRKILINVDESSFDRSLQKKYSWLPVRGSKISITDKPQGKWNLILATFSDGNWFAYIQNGILSSQHFWLFIKLLSRIVKSSEIFENNQIVITLDNARTHASKTTKQVWKELCHPMMFLPPYWPEAAPVETMFGAIKTKMKSQLNYELLNFSNESGADAILQTIESLPCRAWNGAWKRVIKGWREEVLRHHNRLIIK